LANQHQDKSISAATSIFYPQQQTGVATGDEIIWSNNDRQPHWPGRVLNG
jgi:hypothetical protein